MPEIGPLGSVECILKGELHSMANQTPIHITLESQKHGERLSLLQKNPAFALKRGERETVIQTVRLMRLSHPVCAPTAANRHK